MLPQKGQTILEMATPWPIASISWANGELYVLSQAGQLARVRKQELNDGLNRGHEVLAADRVHHGFISYYEHFRFPKKTGKIYRLVPPEEGDRTVLILSVDGRVIQIARQDSSEQAKVLGGNVNGATNTVWENFFQAEDGSNVSLGWLTRKDRTLTEPDVSTLYVFNGSTLSGLIPSTTVVKQMGYSGDYHDIDLDLAGLSKERLFLTVRNGRSAPDVAEVSLPDGKVRYIHHLSDDIAPAVWSNGNRRSNLSMKRVAGNVLAILAEDTNDGKLLGFQLTESSGTGESVNLCRFVPSDGLSYATTDPSVPHVRSLFGADALYFSDPKTLWLLFSSHIYRASLDRRSVELFLLAPGVSQLCFAPDGTVAFFFWNYVFCVR